MQITHDKVKELLEGITSGKGDWYCNNCGLISSGRVTYDETCDVCHSYVQFLEVGELNLRDEAKRIARAYLEKCEENKRQREVLERIGVLSLGKEDKSFLRIIYDISVIAKEALQEIKP